MEQIVDQMGSTEAEGFLPGCFSPEGEEGCQIKIGNKAEYISYAICHVDVDDPLEHKVQAIVQSGGKGTYYNEADKFR